MRDHLGCSRYAAFANKCWPAFQTEFGFVLLCQRPPHRPGIPSPARWISTAPQQITSALCISGAP